MNASFDFERPDHFTAGTVGPVGERTFYLQGREAGTVVSLKAEKGQVGALAEYLAALLANLAAASEDPLPDTQLLEPLEVAWVIGSLAVGYDESSDRVVLIASELVDEESGDEAATARFRLTRAQAAAFVERARALIKAGRPSCRLCGRPIDPQGHVCPRSNGHGRG
jgi:uncharacterized repeat protein (TIGR03847 family)